MSDDHVGLRQAIIEISPEAAWQRCYVHFLRNALDYVPSKVDDARLAPSADLGGRRGAARRHQVKTMSRSKVAALGAEAKAAPPNGPTIRAGTKRALLIDLLRRRYGATVAEIQDTTGWQPHTA